MNGRVEQSVARKRFGRQAFAQFTYRESLRDIEACLGSMSGKLYHMGFRSRIASSTLADANETYDWRIFADFARHLAGVARPLHVEDPMGVDLDHSLYALDSTTIDLCLSLFPWAKFRQHKGTMAKITLIRTIPAPRSGSETDVPSWSRWITIRPLPRKARARIDERQATRKKDAAHWF
jgi:hypothetical protein